MSEIIFEGVKIDEEKARRMYQRILQAEYNNQTSNNKDDSEMVKQLVKIIEEESNAY